MKDVLATVKRMNRQLATSGNADQLSLYSTSAVLYAFSEISKKREWHHLIKAGFPVETLVKIIFRNTELIVFEKIAEQTASELEDAKRSVLKATSAAVRVISDRLFNKPIEIGDYNMFSRLRNLLQRTVPQSLELPKLLGISSSSSKAASVPLQQSLAASHVA